MASHPWVEQVRGGVRFGVLATGSRGRTADGAFLMHDQPVERIVEAGRLAESLGYDAIFVGDHPTFLPDPFVCLTALASNTDRVRLGTLVAVPSFRYPIQLARLTADVDHLSQGRLILGLGVGQVEADFLALGATMPSLGSRRRTLAETIERVEIAWHQSVVPHQQPRPPLIIVGGGKQTLHQVARYADGCNLAGPMGAITPDDVRNKLAYLRQACEDFRRPYDDVLRTYIAVFVVAPDTAQLEAKLLRMFPQEFYEPRMRAGYIIAGTPDRIAGRMQGLVDAGIQYVVAQLADTADEETMRLLASEVIPQLPEAPHAA